MNTLEQVQQRAKNQPKSVPSKHKLLTDDEIIEAGGHRNEAGGWCSPFHGNTCGYHQEFDTGYKR